MTEWYRHSDYGLGSCQSGLCCVTSLCLIIIGVEVPGHHSTICAWCIVSPLGTDGRPSTHNVLALR